MRLLRAYFRLVIFFSFTAGHLTWAVINRFFFPHNKETWVYPMRRWAERLIRHLGYDVEVQGQIPDRQGVLVLPNHRSYADVVFFPPLFPVSFVGKAEVRKWPLIGYGAEAVGTAFVQREDKTSRRLTREAIRERILQGYTVAVFPEGTTTAAPGFTTVRLGMFELAAETGVPIYPVALEYRDPSHAWTGSDTFVPHFIRIYGQRRHEVRVRFGPPMQGNDAEALHAAYVAWLTHNLADLQRDWLHTPQPERAG
ncbi:MAG: lysophospholipid acyltransferase family protein [Bacteroidia bacterium]